MDVYLCRGRKIFVAWRIITGFLFGILCIAPSQSFASEIIPNDNFLKFSREVFEGKEVEKMPFICEEKPVAYFDESEEDFRFRLFLEDMLRGEPIEIMIPFFVKRDRETAAFLVSIARKESSWGEHAPSKDGIDCFNYWGFKGSGSRGVGMGHACFGSPEEAVETVGNRLSQLIHEKKLNSPERLIVWKCGSSCAGHSPESVAKWISDVRVIYSRIAKQV